VFGVFKGQYVKALTSNNCLLITPSN